MNKQQEYFNKLNQITHPNNLKIAVVNYNSKTETYIPGRRFNSDKYEIHDERNIAVNEIVFDFDWSSYKANYTQANNLIEVLKNRKIPYLLCVTGGKGFHVHIFFNKINMSLNESKTIFKDALKYGLTFKHIRLWIWNTILNEAGIDEKYRSKQIDPKVIKFNYYQGTTHLIRDIGGRKHIQNSEGDWKINYKSIILPTDFKATKKLITKFEDVKYPDKIETFEIDESELITYLKDFIKSQKRNKVTELTNERIKGKYIELDGVLKVREGLNEGNRSAGASIIAIACKIDGLNKKEAYTIIEEYTNNCSQSGSKFTSGEGHQWIDWIYNHEKPFWNCQLLEDIGMHERNTCEHCQLQNKEAIEFLTKTTMLDQIKDVLDMEIVGEDDTKILIFLLMLSKDFPSKTGRPDWNLAEDPASQNVILSSDSASGKSWLVKKILTLFGDEEEDFFIISRMTKNAINYYTDINMDGKIIFIEELQGMDEHTSQLRVWMSEGVLNLRTVEKVKNSEGMEENKLVVKKTQGQPVFVTNQAEGVIEDQLNNRSWVLSMDSTEIQTGKILEYQDTMIKKNGKIDGLKIRKIKDALKQLKQYHFIVPYANYKAMNIPIVDIRSRRDYQKFLTLIRCSAYLHQMQREIWKDEDGTEHIICSIEDYNIAKTYSSSILGATFSGLTINQIDLITTLKNSTWKEEFIVSDIMRILGKSQPHWYGMLKQLEDLGYVTAQRNSGNSTIYGIVESKAINIINMPSDLELLEKITPDDSSTYKWVGQELEKLKSEKVRVSDTQLIGAPKVQDVAISKIRINKSGLQLPETMLPADFVSQSEIPALFIGAIGRIDIINYMKKNTKHLIEFADIQTKFDANEKILETLLNQMKSSGTIFEPKPGRYMLL